MRELIGVRGKIVVQFYIMTSGRYVDRTEELNTEINSCNINNSRKHRKVRNGSHKVDIGCVAYIDIDL